MENNTLLIIEEDDDNQVAMGVEAKEEEDPRSRLKLAMANKKLKEDFFKGNKTNQTTEIICSDFENEIHKNMQDLEDNVSLTYSSEDSSEDELNPINGTHNNDDNGEYDVSALRQSYGQQVPSILFPLFERRRLSECKEESETDDEETPTKPIITVTTANGVTHPTEVSTKKRFVVTKANENEIVTREEPTSPQQPVSILKKTPSPPSQQKLTGSPKKIRYDAHEALKDYTAAKNSHTIHFPCSPAAGNGRMNLKNIFSPQGNLNPHLDKRYFDTSLVEIRTSQNQLATSTKSLDDRFSQPLNDIWIKRTDLKNPNSISDKISVSSDSISSAKSNSRKNDVSWVIFYCKLSRNFDIY